MDNYFMDYETAYLKAKQQSTSGIFNDLDICYYNGEKQDNGELQNLIHLPLEHVFEYFQEAPNRHPKNVVANIEDKQLEKQIKDFLQVSLTLAWEEKNKICQQYKEEVQKLQPDFNEPWRILFITTRITTVLQHVAKNLESVFADMGYETFVSIEQNAMQSWGANDSNNNAYFAWHLRNILHFNPHIVFNLDWINNEFLNDSVFNFVWFQDPMSILTDNEEIKKRDRDFYFTLHENYKQQLINKNIDEKKIEIQHFCTNKKIFFEYPDTTREDKIVFLGGDYKFERGLENEDKVIEELLEMINTGTLSTKSIKKLSLDYAMEFEYIYELLLASVTRREIVKWACKQKVCNVEIYGPDDWLQIEEVAPYYKGLLPYGEELAKVYNNAKYALAIHPKYIYQQRLLEISACGAIPIVYDSKLDEERFDHYDNVVCFSTYDEFLECFDKNPKSDSRDIAKDISYEKMAQKIIDTIKTELNND